MGKTMDRRFAIKLNDNKPRHSFKLKAYRKPTGRSNFVFHRLISFNVNAAVVSTPRIVRLSPFLPISFVSTYRRFPNKVTPQFGPQEPTQKVLRCHRQLLSSASSNNYWTSFSQDEMHPAASFGDGPTSSFDYDLSSSITQTCSA